jgi:hypothetical protein
MNVKTNGSALLITLLFLSVIGILAQKLVQSSLLTSHMLKEQINSTEARILALNGLTLACSQLSTQKTPNKKLSPEDVKKKQLGSLLLNLNRWQTFKLTSNLDGMNGTIKICISCEEGKLPTSDLMDLKTKALNKTYIPLLKTFQGITSKKNPGILQKITTLLQKRTIPLEDPTQLNTAFPQSLFFDPAQPATNKRINLPPPTLPWLDLFSSWNVTGKINPLFFSSSMCQVLKLKNPFSKAIDDKAEKELYPRIAETVSKEWSSDWKKNWALLAPLYGAELQISPEITAILSEEVEPTVFSVISCGVVRGVEQRLYAIMHKKKPAQPAEKQPEAAPKTAKTNVKNAGTTCISPENECGIVRMYWVDKFNNIDNKTVGLSA